MKKAGDAYSTKERAELLLSDLERLKAEVSTIEARYNVLKADYTKMCEDAIMKINTIKADLEKNHSNEVIKSGISEPELSNLEARFKLGLMPADTYLKQKGLTKNGDTPATKGVQSIVDKVADCIEFGLDKLGDGLVFPIEITVRICIRVFHYIKSILRREK